MPDRQGLTTLIPQQPAARAAPVRCRPIAADDVESVVSLLVEGFPARKEAVWRAGLAFYLARRGAAAPALGFVLEVEARLVGVLLSFHNAGALDDPRAPVCNLSSWYVRPAFRVYAGLLDQVAQRHRSTTYINISAIRSTWPGHVARGFSRFSEGQFVALPLLARPRGAARVQAYGDQPVPADITPAERRLLGDHRDYGCVSVIATDARGSVPLVFKRRSAESLRVRLGFSPVSYLQLIYCRTTDDVVRFAHAIGRYVLWAHRMPWIVVDADGPVPGLPGRFVTRWGTKFARGPAPIRKGDLSYTELAFFHD